MTNEQLVEKIKNGYSVTEYMQVLYEQNLPLIKKIVKPYANYEPMEDILQEAYFGLCKAIKHYETSVNVLFMTYAGYWIKQTVRRYIENCGSVIRIPGYTKDKIIRYKKEKERLSQEYKRNPTDAEIADGMNVSIFELDNIKGYSQEIASLDIPLYDGSEETVGSNIKDDYSLENEMIDKIYDEHSKNELWGIVERYTSNMENHIIKEYFANNKSIKNIAKDKNLSTVRINKIKENGLHKLRNGKARRELIEKFEVVECGMYRNSMNKFNEHGFTSTVEYIALRKAELQEEYEKKFKEYIGYKL